MYIYICNRYVHKMYGTLSMQMYIIEMEQCGGGYWVLPFIYYNFCRTGFTAPKKIKDLSALDPDSIHIDLTPQSSLRTNWIKTGSIHFHPVCTTNLVTIHTQGPIIVT